MIYYIILGVVAILLIYILLIFNKLTKLKNRVKEAFSTMDVYLKKRWDLIPNLVETVKGYAKHESETLEEIVNLRNKDYNDLSDNEKISTNIDVNKGISKLFLLSENYPDLKASDNFLNLSSELTNIENDIASSRKYYNATVRIYNNNVEMFPSNIVAFIFRFKSQLMFEAKEEEKENVKINL